MRRGSPGHSGCDRATGFTLIELMVVAAIVIVLLTMAIPAVRSMLQNSQQAQAENTLRGALYAARSYALQFSVVAGIRCQEDGHIVQVYARNMEETYHPDKYTESWVYDMKAVEGLEPARLPEMFRVTVRDVGSCDRVPDDGGGYMVSTWAGGPDVGYKDLGWHGGIFKQAAPQWLDTENAWFVFPVVLFSPDARVILQQCKFSGDPARPWYPTLQGAFGKVTDAFTNPNPLFSADRNGYQKYPPPVNSTLIYTNQVSWVGWRCTLLYGQSGINPSQTIPVESPSVSGALRIFNYRRFRALYRDSRDRATVVPALEVVLNTASDMVLNPATGLVTRAAVDLEANPN